MKLKDQWSNIIHQIGDYPFYTIFSTPEQIDFWNSVCTTTEDVSISLDAAGCFVKKNKRRRIIFPYIFVCCKCFSR